MNVTKLCNFLERANNALFISQYAESDRWLDDPTAVMFVNNANVLMHIAGNGQLKEPIPWESARESVAKELRKHQLGWATLAAFPPSNASGQAQAQGLNIGAQYPCHEVNGSQPPILMLIVAIATLAAFAF